MEFLAAGSYLVVLLTLLTVIAFYGWGALAIESAKRVVGIAFPCFALICGWGIVAFLSALISLVVNDIYISTIVLLVFGWLAAGRTLIVHKELGRRDAVLFLKIIFLLFPLLLIASAIPATMFDDFLQWLPNGRYLFEHGHYPTSDLPNLYSDKPSYPYGVPLVGYIVAVLSGEWLETPNKVFYIVLAGFFAAAVAGYITPRHSSRIGVLAISVVALVLLNPVFDPRIAFTVYADTPTGIVFAASILAAWQNMVTAKKSLHINPWLMTWAMTNLCLVFLRNTNVVLIAAAVIGYFLVAALSRRETFLSALRTCLIAISPAIAGVLIWKVYLLNQSIGQEMTIRPTETWNWSAPFIVMRSLLLDRLLNNIFLGVGFLSMLFFVSFGAIFAVRRLPPTIHVLLAMNAVAGTVFVVFLAFMYVSVFSAEEVARAASAWRYMTHFGFSVLLATAISIGFFLPEGALNGNAGRTAIAAVFLLPFALSPYYHIDRQFPDVMAVRRIVHQSDMDLNQSDRILVIHENEAGWYSRVVAYDLNIERHRVIGMLADTKMSLSDLAEKASQSGCTLVLDLRPVDRVQIARNLTLNPVTIYRVLKTQKTDKVLPSLQPVIVSPSTVFDSVDAIYKPDRA